MKKLEIVKCLFAVLFVLCANDVQGQNPSANWDTYIASYDDGKPGSTTVRMDLINYAPVKNLPYVLVTGIKYRTTQENGFPEDETFDILYKLSDELIDLISIETKSKSVFAGSFTHSYERHEYFYINDDTGIKKKVQDFYNQNYPDQKYYLKIVKDKDWTYYREFLYPDEETQNFMSDQAVVRRLQEAGDSLTTPRRVDHWLYFSSEHDMNRCKVQLENRKFSIQSAGANGESVLPFKLVVWRIDNVDIDSIYPITSQLRDLARVFRGAYDGWETSVEIE